VLIEGRRYPLAGTVSMDNVGVDLGPGDAAQALAGRP
jgi:alanine racemase